MNWFSAKARLVCLIENEGAIDYMDSVHLFRAEDFNDAMTTALTLGRQHEEEYRNGDGDLVRWRLKEIISLDVIVVDLEGAEVYSEPVPLEPGTVIPFDAVFAPEDSAPTQTIAPPLLATSRRKV